MDKVVAATPMRDFVLVFTEQGRIYRIWYGDLTDIRIENLAQINLYN